MRTVKAGLVGVGWWGGVLLEGTRNAATIEVTSCHSRTSEARTTFARAHDLEAVADLDAMLGDREIEAIIIATPHSTHADLVVAACEAGKHVFVDKPFVMTVADGRRCVEAADRAGVVLQVGHQRRRQPANRRIKQMIDDGTLGDVVALEANYSGTGGKADPDSWRQDRVERPLSGLTPFGVHVIDTFHSFVGPIRAVTAMSTRSVGATRLDDAAALGFEFESGPVGVLLTSTAVPFVNRVGVLGTEGSAWNEQDGARLGIQLAPERSAREEPVEQLDVVADQMAEFARCILTGTAPEVDGRAGFAVVAVVEAALRSSAERRTVEVEAS